MVCDLVLYLVCCCVCLASSFFFFFFFFFAFVFGDNKVFVLYKQSICIVHWHTCHMIMFECSWHFCPWYPPFFFIRLEEEFYFVLDLVSDIREENRVKGDTNYRRQGEKSQTRQSFTLKAWLILMRYFGVYVWKYACLVSCISVLHFTNLNIRHRSLFCSVRHHACYYFLCFCIPVCVCVCVLFWFLAPPWLRISESAQRKTGSDNLLKQYLYQDSDTATLVRNVWCNALVLILFYVAIHYAREATPSWQLKSPPPPPPHPPPQKKSCLLL